MCFGLSVFFSNSDRVFGISSVIYDFWISGFEIDVFGFSRCFMIAGFC